MGGTRSSNPSPNPTPNPDQVRWAYTEQMGIELEKWEQPLLMVVLDQVSTRGASNTLRLACEDLEVYPSPRRIAPHCPLTAPYCAVPTAPYRSLPHPHPGARPNSARAALRHRAALRRGQAQGIAPCSRAAVLTGDDAVHASNFNL